MEERALSGTEAAPVAAAPPAAVPEDQIPTPVAGEHTEEEPAAAIGEEDGSQEQGLPELTLLVPRPSLSSSSKNSNTKLDPEDVDSYYCLTLPASPHDTIRDIKQTVSESPEGFWIGAHSFQRVLLKEIPAKTEGEDPNFVFDGTPSEILSENIDIAHVFEDGMYEDLQVRRVLRLAETSFTDAEARMHILRLHDAFLGYLPALQSKKLYQPPPYDPNALGLQAGLTVYPFNRGNLPGEDGQANSGGAEEAGHDATVNGHSEDAQKAMPNGSSGGKRGKGKGRAAPSSKATQKVAPGSSSSFTTTQKAETSSADSHSSLLSWLSNKKSPMQIHLDRRNITSGSSTSNAPFKNIQLSPWNPPPPHLRLRGHLLYLSCTTLEGENFHITASTEGFYVNKSDNHHFDPSSRVNGTSNSNKNQESARFRTYHSLFDLLAAVSAQFRSRFEGLLAETLAIQLDFFASAPITNHMPAVPWLVPQPESVPDATRSQIAYLLTGATSSDTLPTARDWNEELTSMRELPQTTNEERLVRDRFASRLFADFQVAAAKAVPSIVRGDVPPLSAVDPSDTRSYLVNNILFTQAQDSVDAFSHLGGDEAARVTSGKDLWAAKLLNDADIPKLNPIATAVVDYCGERWVAQAIPPGIFDRGLTAEGHAAVPANSTEESSVKQQETAGEEGAHATASTKKETTGSSKSATPAPAGLRAVYGPANTDKPNEGYVAQPIFEPLAKQIAEHFHLAKHTVTDTSGRETELWTPADVHGIVAADGRAYVIDLYRLFPVDVNFLEKDVAGEMYSEEQTAFNESDTYPHRVTLLRPELTEWFHKVKVHEWIEQQVKDQADKKAASTAAAATTTSNGDASDDKSHVKSESATSDDFVKVDQEEQGKNAAVDPIADVQETASSKAEDAKTVIDIGDFKLAFNPDAFVDRPEPKGENSVPAPKTNEGEPSTKAVRDASDFLRMQAVPALLKEVVTDELLPLDSAHLAQLMHKHGVNLRYLGFVAKATTTIPPSATGQKLSEGAEQDVLAILTRFRGCLIRDMVARGAKHVLRQRLSGLREHQLPATFASFINCLLGVDAPSPSSSMTIESVRNDIVAEVRRRFRYQIPTTFFEKDLPFLQLLREVALSTGIQLALRPYTFADAPAKPQSDGESKSGRGGASSGIPSPLGVTPEDVLHVYPIVKKAPFRSAFVDAMYQEGHMHYLRGQLDLGEAYVTEALNHYEQIFGAVHPELGEAYRSLAALYHRLTQQLGRRLQVYEATKALAREEDRKQAQAESGLADEEAANAASEQYKLFSQQAVRLARQAVIIYERTTGIDSFETLRCYSDLSNLEFQAGNVDQANRCLQQLVGLSTVMYGPEHPERARAAFFAASMMKRSLAEAVPLYAVAKDLATKAFGNHATLVAQSAYYIAQSCIVNGQFAESVPHLEEAQRIFENRLGQESEPAKETSQLLAAVKQAIEQKQRGEIEKVEKLAKRLGSDSARARELISRMQNGSSGNAIAGAGSHSSKANGATVGGGVNGGAIAANDSGKGAAADKTGSRGHLDVDELVKFIEGGPRKGDGSGGGASKSSKNSKKNTKK